MTCANREIKLTANRSLFATPVLDSYWRWAAERQSMFFKRIAGQPAPWTTDPIIAEHRFTNVYRASDRVSQYLIRNVIYTGSQRPDEILFRILLFKIFNRINTWEHIARHIGGDVTREALPAIEVALDTAPKPIYSAAYIMPDPPFGADKKHRNHVSLIRRMLDSYLADRIGDCRSLQGIYNELRLAPSIGDFLGFQFAIDINYSALCNFSELDYVVAGPGAKGGIKKCFAGTGGLTEAQVIKAMCERQDDEFARLGLTFQTLWGRKLQLIDCQGMFCEVDKYARVKHPEASDISGRKQIKQKYKQDPTPLPDPFFPPKWGINEAAQKFASLWSGE